ncbi:hypothetical protein XENTR_v10009116 [Xenopus tropicalis]|nr:hypothetical protein XENTR_v10009116 [Xenopus tropicalis]
MPIIVLIKTKQQQRVAYTVLTAIVFCFYPLWCNDLCKIKSFLSIIFFFLPQKIKTDCISVIHHLGYGYLGHHNTAALSTP